MCVCVCVCVCVCCVVLLYGFAELCVSEVSVRACEIYCSAIVIVYDSSAHARLARLLCALEHFVHTVHKLFCQLPRVPMACL